MYNVPPRVSGSSSSLGLSAWALSATGSAIAMFAPASNATAIALEKCIVLLKKVEIYLSLEIYKAIESNCSDSSQKILKSAGI